VVNEASLLRRAAERLSRGIAFRRTLPSKYGGATFFASPEGGLRYWRSVARADPVLLNAAADLIHSGDSVWDIGANVGLFTYAAAGLAGAGGHVLAIEPDTWCVDLLRRSMGLNGRGVAPLTVLPAALGDRLGVATLNVATRSRSANFLEGFGGPVTGGRRAQQTITQLTLDWLLEQFGPPHLVKIDVELAEVAVLRGGATLLARHRPVLTVEVDGVNQAAATALLVSHGYVTYDAANPLRVRQDLAPYNTIALPI
jgi:FkbM family methyltransferase